MVELWLIRHGETDWNLEGRYQGQTDIPLNATGRAQAFAFAGELKGVVFDAIYASDLQRAAETARILANRLNMPLNLDARLREIRHGEWEGRLVAEVLKDQVDPRRTDPENFHAPGGETLRQVADRMMAAADDLDHIYSNGKVLVVAHGMSLATLICEAEGIGLLDAAAYIPENCSARIITWPGKYG